MTILLLNMTPDRSLGNSLGTMLEGTDCEYGPIRIEYADSSLNSRRMPAVISKLSPRMVIIASSCHVREMTLQLIRDLKDRSPALPLLVAMGQDDPSEMIEMFKLGISDFIAAPFRAADILPRIWRILGHEAEKKRLTHILKGRIGLGQLVGRCPAFILEINKIPVIAKCDASVLITGETGTGKELFARAIHYLSPRSEKPFIPVNCGAIPPELLENEVFGHARGAYTGADLHQDGLISEAEGGTLFLDEIDALTLSSQVKLLRLVQEREYRRLGSPRSHKADIRLIAATNVDIEDSIKKGSFRKDLYYRLNIIPVALPPLRERKEDIPILSRHFLHRLAAEYRKEVKEFAPEALARLLSHDWPGNIRELDNVIERAVVFSSQSTIASSDIHLPVSIPVFNQSFQKAKEIVVAEFEKTYLKNCLISHEGNISRAARSAGKNRRAFWELIKKHKIDANGLRCK